MMDRRTDDLDGAEEERKRGVARTFSLSEARGELRWLMGGRRVGMCACVWVRGWEEEACRESADTASAN